MDPLTIALLTAGSSALGDLLSYFTAKKQKDEALSALEKAKISERQKEIMASDIDKYFNVLTTAGLNSSVSFNLPINHDVLKGLTASKILAEKSKALADLDTKVAFQNSQLEAAKANLPQISSPINLGNILLSGAMGYMLGDELLKGNTQLSNQSNINQVNVSQPNLEPAVNIPKIQQGVNQEDLSKLLSNSINDPAKYLNQTLANLENLIKKKNKRNR